MWNENENSGLVWNLIEILYLNISLDRADMRLIGVRKFPEVWTWWIDSME